ncbi:subtype B tannase [Paenibacillus sp. FSL H7-0690]|uniref:subtype B tannase n=1 Tax=Paenibacillus sp. FSL H7-0690 TaxID=2921437 RepID=UPI0030EC8894
MKLKKWIAPILTCSLMSLSFATGSASAATNREYSLKFNATNYTTKTITVDGQSVTYRAYENIVYVKNPVDINYETMNVYVPEEYFQGKSIGSYTADTAPIFFPNQVGGYMPAQPGSTETGKGMGMGAGPQNGAPKTDKESAAAPGADTGTELNKPAAGKDENAGTPSSESPSAIAVALSKGYVVASPGARGRTTKDEKGVYTGKAPAAIVDLKAAVRYLRFNDDIMPGDAEKIISNGTSAGGALSALLGATGNNAEYEPYLEAIGAADERDDVFAVSAYTPITNLDNADAAYEWQFNGINTYEKLDFSGNTDFNMERKLVEGTLTEDQIQVSNELEAMFPEYVNSLGLTNTDGTALKMDADGNGTFKDYIKAFVIASAQKALKSGTDLSDKTWITIENGTVTDIDYDQYLAYLGRMKLPGAFDGLDLSNGENDLFGTANVAAQHFTQFGLEHDTAGGTLADQNLVKMMNPMNYISTEGTTTTNNWRIRMGTKDSDTSLAVSTILATELENKGSNVDFAMAWDIPHSGDYDLDELFAWADKVSATSPKASATAIPSKSSLLVNGNKISVNAYNIDGSNYFKLRDIAMVVNNTTQQFEVTSDENTNTLNITSDKTYTPTGIELSASVDTSSKTGVMTATKITLNGQEISVTGYNIGGSEYFKLRDIAKSLDFNLEWDAGTHTISIDTSNIYKDSNK